MDKNLNLIAKELFNKIRTSFPKIKIGDENSQVTDKPEMARFFNFDYVQDGEILGSVNVSLSADDGLVVIYSADLVSGKGDYTKKNFYAFLKELREFAKQKLLTFDTRDISKSNLEKRDFKQLSNNIGEGNMTESKLFGTSKTSYQQLGDSKIIVKHSAPVNYDNPAGRTQRIESIYIENAQGERFRYPYKHLNGARALAQHVAHGGTPYDALGEHVISLSEELSKLRMFKSYVDRNAGLSEAMGTIHSKVMERIDSVKKEIFDLQNSSKYEQFAEGFEKPTDVQIPEEIMNDWVDRLTIRTFNEELKNVFPYIFKLVDESDIPVKELSVDDLLVSEDQDQEEVNTDAVLPELAEYETYLNKIVGEATDIFSNNEEAQGESIAKLNQLVSQAFPVGVDGSNAVESLSGIIDDKELMDIFKELADVNPESDIRDILKDYIRLKDEENGTDVLSKVTFGEEGAGMDAAPEPAPEEPPVEEPAAAEPAPAPEEPAPVTADIWGESVEEQQTEDVFTNKTAELIEFVKSMYNREEGTFPKGETGVLIACEKKFGEGSIPYAQRIVEKLTGIGEMVRVKKLAGLHR